MTGPLRFVLNGEAVEVSGLAATTPLLAWLRYDRALTGSKEGCAEGDCGACTIALQAPGEAGPRPVCACILPIGMVHGHAVTTIDALGRDGLHPVQRAMAEGHGSQCGFCTPGFVMSLWCGYRNGWPVEAPAVAGQLAGNLCRCTGYGPILRAAAAARDLPPPVREPDAEVPRLLAGLDPGPLDYTGDGRRFEAPLTPADLLASVAAAPDATILSGATDIGLWITKQDFDPAHVIWTGRVDGFADIAEEDGWIEIGAGATFADAAPSLGAHWPAMAGLIDRIGGAQVRAMGTVGGNIANGSPIGDMPPALIAVGAQVVLCSAQGRREIPLEAFFVAYGQQDLAPDEVVWSVRVPIPLPGDGARLSCDKISKRRDQDITAVLGCFDIAVAEGQVQSARLAFGGMSGTPARAPQAEAALTGAPWTRPTLDAAMQALTRDFVPMDDHRASAAYRMQAAQNLLLRHFLERTEPGTRTRIGEIA